jgi:hypothetical protein
VYAPRVAANTWKLSSVITLVFLVLVLLHLLFPDIKVDIVTAFLLLIAVAPWLGRVLRSIEIGATGLKVEYQELKDAENRAAAAGLIEKVEELPKGKQSLPVSAEDPNLALAALRIEIERRLREIAQAYQIPTENKAINQLLADLTKANALSQTARGILLDIISILNKGAHGAYVEPAAADWVMQVGPVLIAALERKSDG